MLLLFFFSQICVSLIFRKKSVSALDVLIAFSSGRFPFYLSEAREDQMTPQFRFPFLLCFIFYISIPGTAVPRPVLSSARTLFGGWTPHHCTESQEYYFYRFRIFPRLKRIHPT